MFWSSLFLLEELLCIALKGKWCPTDWLACEGSSFASGSVFHYTHPHSFKSRKKHNIYEAKYVTWVEYCTFIVETAMLSCSARNWKNFLHQRKHSHKWNRFMGSKPIGIRYTSINYFSIYSSLYWYWTASVYSMLHKIGKLFLIK